MSTICEKRGHYYLPIDLPVSNDAYWSILPPAPERILYCRRCGKTTPLTFNPFYQTMTTGTITVKNSSAMFSVGSMDPWTATKRKVDL